MTLYLEIVQITIKFYYDIPSGYQVMECIRLVHTKAKQRDLTLGQSMREQPLLHVTHCLAIKHSYEALSRYSKRLSSYGMHKTSLERTNQRGLTWKLKKGEQPALYANILLTSCIMP